MANNNWTGALNDGDNAAGNWSGNHTPTTGEDVLVAAESIGYPGCTVNPAASAAILINSLVFGAGYTRTWGGSGAHFEISAEYVLYQGSEGKLWLKEGSNAGGTNTVVCDSSSSNPFEHDCLQLADTLFDRLLLRRGITTLESGCAVTDVKVGTPGGGTEAKLVINAGVTTPTKVTMLSGVGVNGISAAALTALDIHGGDWTQSAGSNVITTLNVFGGIVRLYTGGTFAEINHHGGIIDATRGGLHAATIYRRIPMGVTPPIVLGEGNPAMWAPPTTQPSLIYLPNAA